MNRRLNMSVEVQPDSQLLKTMPRVAVVGAEAVTVTKTSGISEASVEEEVNVRAETMTVVLSKILEHPVGVRHWGINE